LNQLAYLNKEVEKANGEGPPDLNQLAYLNKGSR